MPTVRPLLPLLLAVLVALAACDATDRPSGEPSTPATAGLVLLSGATVAESLVVWDAAGATEELPLPDPSAAWLSVSRRGALIATLADGTLRLSTRLPVPPDEQFAWRVVPSIDAQVPEEPLLFTTWAPNGLVTAALADDLAERRSLVIIDPIGDATLVLPLDRGPLPAPLGWLDVDRVAIPSGDQVTVVNTQTGDHEDRPGAVAQLTISGDGSRIALVRREDGGLDVAPAAEWLAGTVQPEISLQAGSAAVNAIALDRRGERLAIVWHRDGQPGLVTIHRRSGSSWTEVARFDVPGGGERGIPGWLP